MKYSILIGVLLLSTLSTSKKAQAQNDDDTKVHRVEIGFRFLPTFSSFKLATTSGGAIKTEITPGFGFGALIGTNITKQIGIQAEILYNSLSQKYKDQNLDRKINVTYLNIPLLCTFNSNKAKRVNFTAVLGPQIGFNLGSKISGESGTGADTLNTVIALKSSDLGIAYGAGMGFMLNDLRTIRFDLGYRGVYGFVNINKNTVNTNTSYTIQKADIITNAAYLGITFLF